MQRQIYREFIEQTAAMIHELDPRCLVAVNWAYSLRMPEKPAAGVDYVTGDIGNRVEGLSAEAHWYDGLGLPFDLMTQLNTQYPGDVEGGSPERLSFGPKPPVQIQQEMAIIVANGGRFWIWDNPTPESGLIASRHEYLARHVAPWLKERKAWCLGTRRLPDVSLLNASTAHYAVTDAAGTVCFNRRDNRIDGAATTLPRQHLNYEMVGDWRLHEQDIRSPVLIVEHPKRLTSEDVDALVAYVRDGGTLLLAGMGLQRENDALHEVFGIAAVVGPKQAERLIVTRDARELAFEHHLFRPDLAGAETVIPVVDARGDQQPLLVRHRFGEGVAYYFATPLLSEHGKNLIPDLLMRAVLEEVLPTSKRLVTTDAPESVEIVLRAEGRIAFYTWSTWLRVSVRLWTAAG